MADTYFIKEKKDKNFTVLDNTFIKDTSLSWKAKGVMTYLLSLPEDWKVNFCEIEKHACDGRDSLRSAIKELREKGYLVVEQTRNEKGLFTETVYKIIEKPQTEIPFADNPLADEPHAENPKLLNTNNNKILNKLNTNNTKTRTSKPFKKPTYEEVENYCKSRNSCVNPKTFYKYFDEGNWYDAKGNKVKNWKQKIITWESFGGNKNGVKNKPKVTTDYSKCNIENKNDNFGNCPF